MYRPWTKLASAARRAVLQRPLVPLSRASSSVTRLASGERQWSSSRPSTPAMAPLSTGAWKRVDDEEDEEIAQYTAESMAGVLGDDDSSSLDLELGEGCIWDQRDEHEDPLDDGEDSLQPVSPPPQHRHRSAIDILSQFDPLSPPASSDPRDLQLWLECEAQQEAVLRYQAVIDSARDRKDYSSLSLVQRQVLAWFQPLKEEIERRQKQYVLKSGDQPKASKRFGPFLCTLPAEKLAVIVAHEAIMHTLLYSGLDGKDGTPFVSLAKRIGEAVEEEVVIHRALRKRFKEAQAERLSQEEEDIHALVEPVDAEAVVEHVEDGAFDSETHNWVYATSHLKSFMDEINRYQPSSKKRRVVLYALRRARQILENEEEWTVAERIQLGAALFQILLEKATIVQDGREEMAFNYEKIWVKKHKLRSFVQLNERLYKMVVSDKLQSLSATTTRHKPMIMEPRQWKSPNDGGYLWLKTDLMRYHGCNTQEVRRSLCLQLIRNVRV